jgi:hypothetical protein
MGISPRIGTGAGDRTLNYISVYPHHERVNLYLRVGPYEDPICVRYVSLLPITSLPETLGCYDLAQVTFKIITVN